VEKKVEKVQIASVAIFCLKRAFFIQFFFILWHINRTSFEACFKVCVKEIKNQLSEFVTMLFKKLKITSLKLLPFSASLLFR
jgi:hypothetical protein